MYIIMNTAVSKQWGFPPTCPANCPCKEYDCNSNKFQEICGFSPGFCDMMTNKTDIPSYRVNYVRVYQDPSNPKHKVGCSTPERPTRKYIQAHQDLYKTKNDVSNVISVFSMYVYARHFSEVIFVFFVCNVIEWNGNK
jgi:hypothetical protein